MKTSQKAAFCGLLCAMAVVTLMLTVFPYATYALAALAGMLMIPAVLELGVRYGVICYIVTALLAAFLTPDAEAKLMFMLFFGYYPICQCRVNLWAKRRMALLLKFVLFNAAAVVSFILSITVLGVEKEAFMIGGVYLPWVLLILGNIVFIVYDIALTRVTAMYRVRLHPLVKRLFK